MSREATATAEKPASSSASSARPSRTAIGRSLGFERALLTVLGLVLLLAGLLALVVGAGWLGRFRAQRSVLDPMVTQWITGHRPLTCAVAIVVGIVLALLGIWWLLRALRPEGRPDLQLHGDSEGSATITSSALTEAVRADAESVTGVTRAKVRMAGTAQRPNVRLTLALQEGTNVRHVWEELDDKVLSRARRALEVEAMPTAVRLQLDRAARQRVR
ncbi:alkaline shock response membrane anchor protein AmaP [Saccharopolyspora sp. NFXS83]|uniref:alkaline shock response membrane anchor protein AmaP n=1 Tax=Saccharopolyspora sp. NFXS83 TaxID=2993560 RepID=UPI00224B60E5|nr:alkaline shock response membrane anchor protein AmaP [Saccharopolyspora sp. NFXS83]MCX2730877.1 alkaline shock response membrane anchor protein AmaP [Saccharopolyspora sp. NFXS83]